jgi:membrane protein implicated in regulation of membrane protease activity
MRSNMENHPTSPFLTTFLIGPIAFSVSVALAAGWLGVLWWHPETGRNWQALLLAAVLVGLSILGWVWQFRIRAARRLRAAVDAYAEREISQARRRQSRRPSVRR